MLDLLPVIAAGQVPCSDTGAGIQTGSRWCAMEVTRGQQVAHPTGAVGAALAAISGNVGIAAEAAPTCSTRHLPPLFGLVSRLRGNDNY